MHEDLLTRLRWAVVPAEAARLVREVGPAWYKAAAALPAGREAWLDPADGTIHADRGPGGRLLVKSADTPVSSVLRPVGQAAGLLPSWWTDQVGGPTPLAAALAGGTLAAGGGYLAGRVAEHLLPDRMVEPGKLRRLGAVLGGAAGAFPGLALGAYGMADREDDSSPWRSWVEPHALSSADTAARTKIGALIEDACRAKAADFGGGSAFLPRVEVDDFNRVVLRDPYLAPQYQAATVGLTESANQMAGGTGLVSPLDLSRIALGMGAGLTQAYLGGKVLGALAGLTPQAQTQLQRVGAFAGAVKAVVPGMFGR